MSENKEKLFAEFEPVTPQQWREKIEADLKGADFDKKLVWRTNEGFSMQPFYTREDVEKLKTPDALPGEYPYVRGNNKDTNAWYVRQNIRVSDPKTANAKALDILSKGVDSIGFAFGGNLISEDFVNTLLDGIYCDCIELNFNTCKRRSVNFLPLLDRYLKAKGYDPERITGSLDWDPIEKIVMHGMDVRPILNFAPLVVEAMRDYPHFRTVTVNSIALCNAGAYIVQELGYALAWGNEYMAQLTEAGISGAEAARNIKFNMGVSENYFMEIAKFRAARLLWAHIVSTYTDDTEAARMCINAETTTYNMTMFDSYVNLLRTQTEAMSAAIAGVHSIVVTPFDSIYEQPTDFSERIARNQQLLLKEESHFDKVVDPSAGSYFIEELTTSLADAAWKIFLKMEDEGGFLQAIENGTVQDDINNTNAARHNDAARRREFILGTNQYPNFTETSEGKRPADGACGGGCGHHDKPFKSIQTARKAADFEQLRLATEAAGHVPVAFMLTIGNLAWRQARAQFSSNFLACAGYRIIDNLGFDTVEDGVEAAVKAGADIVVLCSSDEEYATLAIPAFKALDGRAMFVVAGAPACADELKAAGITDFINVRSNVLETLKDYNARLGITPPQP